MKAPKRRCTLKIDIGGDDWEDIASALEGIAFRIYSEGPITSIVSGGYSSGYVATGIENQDQTGDKFRRENHEYVHSLKSSRVIPRTPEPPPPRSPTGY